MNKNLTQLKSTLANIENNINHRKTVHSAIHKLYHLIKKGNDFIYEFVKKGSIEDLKAYADSLSLKWIPQPKQLFKGYWVAPDKSTYHIDPPGASANLKKSVHSAPYNFIAITDFQALDPSKNMGEMITIKKGTTFKAIRDYSSELGLIKEDGSVYMIPKNKKKQYIKKTKASSTAGIGYELYAKGLDRIAHQCNNVSQAATDLAKLVRENAAPNKKKKALKELTQWINSINGEMKGVTQDFNNLEGY